jgi:hypothetical protein
MEPNISDGILLHEGHLSIKFGDKVQDCKCRVTFDLARKYHVVIDCLESVHEILGGPLWFSLGKSSRFWCPAA